MGPLRTTGEAWKGGLQGHTSPYPLSRSVPPPPPANDLLNKSSQQYLIYFLQLYNNIYATACLTCQAQTVPCWVTLRLLSKRCNCCLTASSTIIICFFFFFKELYKATWSFKNFSFTVCFEYNKLKILCMSYLYESLFKICASIIILMVYGPWWY